MLYSSDGDCDYAGEEMNAVEGEGETSEGIHFSQLHREFSRHFDEALMQELSESEGLATVSLAITMVLAVAVVGSRREEHVEGIMELPPDVQGHIMLALERVMQHRRETRSPAS